MTRKPERMWAMVEVFRNSLPDAFCGCRVRMLNRIEVLLLFKRVRRSGLVDAATHLRRRRPITLRISRSGTNIPALASRKPLRRCSICHTTEFLSRSNVAAIVSAACRIVDSTRTVIFPLAMSYNLTCWQVVELLPNTVPLIRRLRLESIPHAANGGQMARLRGLFLDISPQAHDESCDGARIGVLPPSPNIFEHDLAV